MNHLPEECPTLKVTCCLCEGEDHVPSQCPLSPLIAAENHKRRMSQQNGPNNPVTSVGRIPISEVVCFGCGQKGHYKSHCPDKQNPNSHSSTPTPGQSHSARRAAQHRKPNAARGRLNHVQAEEAQGSADVILGTIAVNSAPAQVLFDPKVSHSFVTQTFIEISGMKPRRMRKPMIVQIPGSKTRTELTCPKVPVEIHGVVFPANLIVLGAEGIDVILGMNWLSKYHGRIDCTRRTVDLTSAEGVHVIYTAKLEPTVIQASQCQPMESFPDI